MSIFVHQIGWNRGQCSSLCIMHRDGLFLIAPISINLEAIFMSEKKIFSMEQIVSHAKHRGFVFPGSEIYGGLANTWDYGPLGAELKNNVKKAWWKKFIQECPMNVGLDSAILMNPKVWEASGHVGGFNDPMVDCKECKARHRADKLIEDALNAKGIEVVVDGMSFEKMEALINEHKIACPDCGKLNYTNIRQFNLMFKTFQGVTEDAASQVYLRPETAQGIFVNFKNVQRTMRKKLPFGIAQIGKSFRNEITPKNFIFRMREFEQMELEFFCKPGEELEWHGYWKDYVNKFLLSLNLNPLNLRARDHGEEELSHYSNATTDYEYKFPFGWGELWGIASRTDFDLKQHMAHSGEDFNYQEPESDVKYVPYCIEPSVGVDRLTLALFVDAYDEEALEDGTTRNIMHFHPAIAPIKAAVLPLSKKLSDKANEIFAMLGKQMTVDYDDAGAIGRRYRRHDEIGTPFCVTIDFDTLEDLKVTVRERDTMAQERIAISDLVTYLTTRIEL